MSLEIQESLLNITNSEELNSPISDISINNSNKCNATITNILSKHCNEIKNASDDIVQPVINMSKKKLKELIKKHNNEVFSFLAKSDKVPQMIGLADTIIKKYGQDIPTINAENASSILRNLSLDISLCDVTKSFNENLKKSIGEGGLEGYLQQTRWLFNQYKILGEEVLRLETILFQKIDLLDKLNSKVSLISTLEENEVLPDLMNMFHKYIESSFKSTNIEDTYRDLIEAYKKWNICRQIICLHNNFKDKTNDPQCSICITEPVSNTIVPCGHTFCSNCIKKQNTTCYICRGTIRERVKLYFT
jgi:hypothetical protein